MKRPARITACAVCFTLLIIAWLITVTAKSAAEKQLALLERAAALTGDGIFVRAIPLLEEAAGYSTEHTAAAEEELKKAYLALIGTRGYQRKYVGLLETQMGREDAGFEVFSEAAGFYLGLPKIPEALDVLKKGIEKTGDGRLAALYEKNRYAYEMTRASYDYVSAIYGSTVQVRTGGKWGIAASDGVLLIPCEYDKISTFSNGRAVVRRGNDIYTVNAENNRTALLSEPAEDFGNLAYDRTALLIGGQWIPAAGDFTLQPAAFQRIGLFSEGYAAAMSGGKWGIVNLKYEWLIPPEYDGVVQDEPGRCYAQGAVFVRKNGTVYLFTGGEWAEGSFDDARPFSGEGYAAVRKNGKWGFIDNTGKTVIGFEFDDALSFGQHVAAVRAGGLWGYINMSGEVVIEPVFQTAKSFSNGSAPVMTERGWQFITLIEYKSRRVGL